MITDHILGQIKQERLSQVGQAFSTHIFNKHDKKEIKWRVDNVWNNTAVYRTNEKDLIVIIPMPS